MSSSILSILNSAYSLYLNNVCYVTVNRLIDNQFILGVVFDMTEDFYDSAMLKVFIFSLPVPSYDEGVLKQPM